MFEHAPVKAEGCWHCHTPHGSQNPRLLNMPSIATLCNQCHSPLSAGGVHGLDAGSTTVTPCITCHTDDPWLECQSGICAVTGNIASPARQVGAAQAPGQRACKAQGFDVGNGFIQVRLHMKNIGWFSRILNQQPSFAMFLGMVVAMLPCGRRASLSRRIRSTPAPSAGVNRCRSRTATLPITPSTWAAACPVSRGAARCMTPS